MTTVTKRVSRAGGMPPSGMRASLITLLLWVGVLGCGPEGPLEELMLESHYAELDSLNGLSANGLSANGLSANGLSANGLSANGLSANGLSTSAFSGWFSNDPALADMVMRYVVRCALPSGETLSYADTSTGQHYTWNGVLGLAPGWASGATASSAEQQIITACLMAHVNRHGLSTPVSILGRDALGALIPFTQSELETYTAREACFFGNLFTQEGLFFGVDQPVSNEAQYLTRACAGLEDASGNRSTSCAPLRYVGGCTQSCMPDPKGPFYSRCMRNGVSYLAITTRLRQSDYEQLFEATYGSDTTKCEPKARRGDFRWKQRKGAWR